MKKLIWFTTISVLFLTLIAPAILALGIKLIPGDNQPGYNYTLDIYGERDVTQKFVSQSTNLSAIGTSIKNPNLKNKQDIILKIFDDKMAMVRTVILNGRNIEDGSLVRIVFDPIPDSEDKTYYFNLSSPNAGPEDKIEVFLSQNPPGWIEQYSYGKDIYPGGLPIILYFKPASKFGVIKDIYSNLFSRLLHLNFQKTN